MATTGPRPITYPVFGRTAHFHPDVLGRAREISVPAGSMLGATYWPNGQAFDIAFAGGSRLTYGQNGREWPSSMTVRTGDGIAQIDSAYEYDVAGNYWLPGAEQMKFIIEIASVPDRDDVVAEIWWGDAMVAELQHGADRRIDIEIYPSVSGGSWRFNLDEWLAVVQEARRRLA